MAYYIHNTEKNGIEIYFEQKPSNDIVSKLKKDFWKWHSAKKCWYNYFSEVHEEYAKSVCTDAKGHTEEKAQETIGKKPLRTNNCFETKLKYKLSEFRIDPNIIERDFAIEKELGIDGINVYGYFDNVDHINFFCRVYSNKGIPEPVVFDCVLYDKDNDVIGVAENSWYGSWKSITPKVFFNGLPFRFYFSDIKAKKVCRVKVTPRKS